jgi:hypothetical protein
MARRNAAKNMPYIKRKMNTLVTRNLKVVRTSRPMLLYGLNAT